MPLRPRERQFRWCPQRQGADQAGNGTIGSEVEPLQARRADLTPVGRLLFLSRKPALVFIPVALALGAIAGALLPVKYTAETRLAVGTSNLSAQSVPGYVVGLV